MTQAPAPSQEDSGREQVVVRRAGRGLARRARRVPLAGARLALAVGAAGRRILVGAEARRIGRAGGHVRADAERAGARTTCRPSCRRCRSRRPARRTCSCTRSPAEHEAPSTFSRTSCRCRLPGGGRLRRRAGVKQRVPLQTNGLHGIASGATHWPVALHVDGGLVHVARSQFSAAHSVPTGQLLAAAAPSHLPFVPHVDAPESRRWRADRRSPVAIGVQCPSDADSAQLRQAPVHA